MGTRARYSVLTRVLAGVVAAGAVALTGSSVFGDEAATQPSAQTQPPAQTPPSAQTEPSAERQPPAEKGPPLPLHTFSGVSGTLMVPSACFANPPSDGDVFALPSVSGIHLSMGHGRDMDVFNVTDNVWGRFELGYAYNRFDIGDLGETIRNATGISIHDQFVELHHFNARAMLIKEGDFGQSWIPAVTAGVEYMDNTSINDLNRELNGTLRKIGIFDDQGADYTLHATKTITALPRPVMLTAGARLTEAADAGLLGFTHHWKVVGEGSVCVMITDRLVLAGEYRQNPNEYKAVSGICAPESDWWSVCLAYILSKHATVAAGYANFGTVMNHEAREVWGVELKYEF
jgi:hypothetical protein